MVPNAPGVWRRSAFCAESACVDLTGPLVVDEPVMAVRNSHRPEDIHFVPVHEWDELTAAAQAGTLDLTRWLPAGFVRGLTPEEIAAFTKGLQTGRFTPAD